MENWTQQIRISRDLWLDHINQMIEAHGEDSALTDADNFIRRTCDYAFAVGTCEQDSIRCTIELMRNVSPEKVNQGMLDRCGITKEDFDGYKNQYRQAMEYIHECEMAGLAEDIEDQRKEESYINKHFRDIGADKEFWE